jgi:magnesium chelatase family protein
MQQLGLSARAYHRVLRVARTVADLAGSPCVLAEHVAEAITLRQLDRRSSVAGQGGSVSD